MRARETHQNTVISGCVCAAALCGIPAVSIVASAWKRVSASLKVVGWWYGHWELPMGKPLSLAAKGHMPVLPVPWRCVRHLPWGLQVLMTLSLHPVTPCSAFLIPRLDLVLLLRTKAVPPSPCLPSPSLGIQIATRGWFTCPCPAL